MRKILALALTTATALVLGFSAQAPATGGTPGFMSCPGPVKVGALTGVDPSTYIVTGTITPCHVPGPGDYFGVAIYNGTVAYGKAVNYLSLTAGNQFAVDQVFPVDIRAVCLISDNGTRIDCIEVTRDPQFQLIVGGHLSVTSPLVSAQTRLFPSGSGPKCSPCWPLD